MFFISYGLIYLESISKLNRVGAKSFKKTTISYFKTHFSFLL